MGLNRKTRSDSAQAHIDAMQNAGKKPLRPPKHCKLRKQDQPYWRDIIASRARSEWSKVDLVIAAQLARTQADYASEQARLETEHMVEYDQYDKSYVNARCRVLEILARREMALMRALRLAGVTAGTPRDNATKRDLERTAREIHAALLSEDDDGLLATP